MRILRTLVFALTLIVTPTLADEPPPKVQESGARIERQRFFVHLNCDPRNTELVTKTLRLAKSLCGKNSNVTLFIDLQAAVLADKRPAVLNERNRAAVDELFAGIRDAGGTILLCPNCAKLFSLDEKQMREGVRMTTAEEFRSAEREADQVFEYREEKAEQKSSGKPALET